MQRFGRKKFNDYSIKIKYWGYRKRTIHQIKGSSNYYCAITIKIENYGKRARIKRGRV